MDGLQPVSRRARLELALGKDSVAKAAAAFLLSALRTLFQAGEGVAHEAV